MLKDYPVLFDEEEVMQWTNWKETRNVVETTYETEAGVDQVNVVRYDKLTIEAKYRCHSTWAGKFTAYSKQDQITVSLYDPEVGGYKQRIMRIREFESEPVEFSENVTDTDGVWDVSFRLEEF